MLRPAFAAASSLIRQDCEKVALSTSLGSLISLLPGTAGESRHDTGLQPWRKSVSRDLGRVVSSFRGLERQRSSKGHSTMPPITPATTEKSEVPQKSTSSALHESAGQCGHDGVCQQNITARQSTYSHPCPMPPDMQTPRKQRIAT
mmetsp:Transcript_27432/g.72189  ORF Transcript_27432/g.72189 Transcript_27432/m.72189 type:complete len:146 (+) Transcript_27432:38-475(+)